MSYPKATHHLNAVSKRFRGNRRANVGIIFALSVIPMVCVAGAAYDYSRALSVKSTLQTALDATALAVTKDAANVSASQLQTEAQTFFAPSFHSSFAGSVKINATYDSTTSTVTVTGKTNVPTTVMNLVKVTQMPVAATASASWGLSSLQIALVLDNTGSMKDTDSAGTSKISALKTAAHNFLSTMQSASTATNNIRVAIVPFNTGVNVGTANVNASWLDWSYYSNSGGMGAWLDGGTWSGGGSSTNNCTWSTCWSTNNKTWSTNGSTTDKSHWNGCVMDRDQSYNAENTTPVTSNASTLFPAVYSGATPCPVAVMGLSDDWTALNAKVDSMTAGGKTNQTIGLAWGWQALTPGVPLNAPTASSGTEKVIILMSDGMNTEDRWSTNQSDIDARMKIACDNVKADGVTIYTVLVMAGNSSVLQSCASDSSKYFALTSTDQLITTFDSIATKLSKLRLTN